MQTCLCIIFPQTQFILRLYKSVAMMFTLEPHNTYFSVRTHTKHYSDALIYWAMERILPEGYSSIPGTVFVREVINFMYEQYSVSGGVSVSTSVVKTHGQFKTNGLFITCNSMKDDAYVLI